MFLKIIIIIKEYKGTSHSKKLKKSNETFLIFLTNTSLYFVVRKCLTITMKKMGYEFVLCNLKYKKKLSQKVVLLIEPLFEMRVKIDIKCDLQKMRTW